MTEKQVASMIGLSVITLQSWRTKGEGPAFYKLGDRPKGKVLYKEEDVQTWLESCRKAPK